MDGRNDDSGGSDYSLNTSLQKKCVVDDMMGARGEGVLQQNAVTNDISEYVKNELTSQTAKKDLAKDVSGTSKTSNLTTNTTAAAMPTDTGATPTLVGQKTEQVVKECDGGGGGGGGVTVDSGVTYSGNGNGKELVKNVLSLEDDEKLCDGIKNVACTTELNKQQTTEVINTIIQDSIINTIEETNNAADNTASGLQTSCSGNNCGSSSNNKSSTNSSNNAFETKVKQISKNLKETTLAETQINKSKAASLEENNASSTTITSPSISSSSLSIDYDTSLPSNSTDEAQCNQAVDLNASLQSVSESTDDTDHRSKKVRFHPDVKENDGGNRIIPKKKKKIKNNSSSGLDEAMPSTSAAAAAAAANAQRMSSVDDDMDMEDEEEFEEEEDFDLEKTIAEANDFLKVHPLTFARAQDKKPERIRNGLLEEEDLPEPIETSEDDDDIYEYILPENGVERILGKQTKGSKVEFLLRYVDRPGLFWEQEDFITKNCPNLLNTYEMFRERRQERLMSYVATRQNIRQRYTDF